MVIENLHDPAKLFDVVCYFPLQLVEIILESQRLRYLTQPPKGILWFWLITLVLAVSNQNIYQELWRPVAIVV